MLLLTGPVFNHVVNLPRPLTAAPFRSLISPMMGNRLKRNVVNGFPWSSAHETKYTKTPLEILKWDLICIVRIQNVKFALRLRVTGA